METALHIIIGTMSFCIIVSIPCIIYGLYDNKRLRKEKAEKEAAA